MDGSFERSITTLFPVREKSIQLPEPGTAVWELSHNEMQWLFSGIHFMKQKVRKPNKIECFFRKNNDNYSL